MNKKLFYLIAFVAILFAHWSPAQAQTSGTSLLVFNLNTNDDGAETWFRLRDLNTGSVLLSTPPGSLADNASYSYSVFAYPSHCIKLEIWDTAEDGGATWGGSFNGQTFASVPYTFLSTQMMGASTCNNFGPVNYGGNYVITTRGKLVIGNDNKFSGAIGGGKRSAVCMGARNQVSRWIAADTVNMGRMNNIAGLNGNNVFLAEKLRDNCSPGGGLPSQSPWIKTPPGGGLGNTADCDPTTPIEESIQDVKIDGPGVLMTLAPGHYRHITVTNGATLMLENGNFTCELLEIRHSTLIPNFPGGGVLCDVFVYTHDAIFRSATVMAHVNCETLNGEQDNTFMGSITIKDPSTTSHIGDNNKFVLAACPDCDKKKSGSLKQIEKIEGEVGIWPNPVKDRLNWGGILDQGGDLSLKVFDLNGKEVLSENLSNPGDGLSFKSEVDAGHLNRGIYLFRISCSTGFSQSGKFILSN